MRIAIMQPYLFPYLGYFQLMNNVDIFVCLDDVNFIKKGWIHRNRLIFNQRISWFTVPIRHASQNTAIYETMICQDVFSHWREKFFRSLECFYAKTPFYTLGLRLASEVFSGQYNSIADMARASLRACCALLDISTRVEPTSSAYNHTQLKGGERLIAICKKAGGTEYVNPAGGMGLYSKKTFAEHGLTLRFIKPELHPYTDGKNQRMAGLSILDALMCCGPNAVRDMIAMQRRLV